MTDKEIEAIAREYAESNIPNGVDENYSRSIIYSDGEMFGRFLRWLSERYEIVSKESIKEIYKKTEEWGKHAHVKCQVESRANINLLDFLFPQTLKSEEK